MTSEMGLLLLFLTKWSYLLNGATKHIYIKRVFLLVGGIRLSFLSMVDVFVDSV